MDTNSLYALMDAAIVGSGVYVIYLYITMVKSGTIKSTVLLPQNLQPKKCKDVAGYIAFIGRKQLGFGIVAIACGLIGLLQDFTQKIGMIPYMTAITVFFIYAIWFGMQVKKSGKLFW